MKSPQPTYITTAASCSLVSWNHFSFRDAVTESPHQPYSHMAQMLYCLCGMQAGTCEGNGSHILYLATVINSPLSASMLNESLVNNACHGGKHVVCPHYKNQAPGTCVFSSPLNVANQRGAPVHLSHLKSGPEMKVTNHNLHTPFPYQSLIPLL